MQESGEVAGLQEKSKRYSLDQAFEETAAVLSCGAGPATRWAKSLKRQRILLACNPV
jgi:hypothetical protein